MEEILASIRRIIADDNPDVAKAAAAAPASSPAPQPHAAPPAAAAKPAMSQDDIDAMLADQADDDGDVLELGDPVSPPAANFRQVPAGDVVFREESPVREQAPAQAMTYEQPRAPAERLLSQETNAAVSAAFGSLASTILSENSRTIEDLVREMLRPMLKAWLDDNLPGLVERMVRAEIERVSRGAR
jgi:cell pole-organizing protein PopZ